MTIAPTTAVGAESTRLYYEIHTATGQVTAPYHWANPLQARTAIPGVINVHISTPPTPRPEVLSEWSKPATYTSILALVVSVGVVCYTFWKDTRARKHSVEDDYWLRKVVGPIAIEPLLKDILEMIAAAPNDATSATFSSEATNKYHTTYLAKLSSLAVNSSSLQIIDKQLAAGTAAAIDQLQDLMIGYCSANIASHEGVAGIVCQDKDSFQSAAKEALVELLKPIRDYHVKKVGKAGGRHQTRFARFARWFSRS